MKNKIVEINTMYSIKSKWNKIETGRSDRENSQKAGNTNKYIWKIGKVRGKEKIHPDYPELKIKIISM